MSDLEMMWAAGQPERDRDARELQMMREAGYREERQAQAREARRLGEGTSRPSKPPKKLRPAER